MTNRKPGGRKQSLLVLRYCYSISVAGLWWITKYHSTGWHRPRIEPESPQCYAFQKTAILIYISATMYPYVITTAKSKPFCDDKLYFRLPRKRSLNANMIAGHNQDFPGLCSVQVLTETLSDTLPARTSTRPNYSLLSCHSPLLSAYLNLGVCGWTLWKG